MHNYDVKDENEDCGRKNSLLVIRTTQPHTTTYGHKHGQYLKIPNDHQSNQPNCPKVQFCFAFIISNTVHIPLPGAKVRCWGKSP